MNPDQPLAGHVALVAGATRGAGRGIACMLGEAGATVYCSGRSTREHPPIDGVFAGRRETIDETADMVRARGGTGIAVRTDHLDERQVAALCARIAREQGRLDLVVNDISEGEMHDWGPFWKVDLEKGFRALQRGVNTHIITARHAAPLMVAQKRGLIVEIGDGDALYYRGTLFYDLVKVTTTRLAFAMAEDLHPHGVTALAVTPGFMRTEMVLEHFGVTDQTWRDGVQKDALFEHSETPFLVGRAAAALAADPRVFEKSGALYTSIGLAREYGFTDVDGGRPDIWPHVKAVIGSAKTGIQWEQGPIRLQSAPHG
jgi:NAD(P)-dependent dehydrogenase (short-subunit alcohol dehydrogenase family)